MERFNRLELAVGDISNLKEKTVAIIGIGGVGGYALEAIARSGIGHIIIMDYDIFDITNINRQILALDSTVGLKKVDVAKKRLLDINPYLKVITIDKPYNEENKNLLFQYQIDYLIDAFDTVTMKIDCIKECKNRLIPIISSMGMANRFDPSKIAIMKLKNTTYDPVAKVLRSKLKDFDVTVVASVEAPLKLEGKLASNSFVPATAGLMMASYVINYFLKG